MNASASYSSRLRSWQGMHAAGVAAHYLLRIAAFGLPVLCLYGLADAFLSLPESSRQVWNLLFPALLLGLSLLGLKLFPSLSVFARELDRRRKDPRRTLSCALDLEQQPCETDWQHDLRARSLEDARGTLRNTPVRLILPAGPALRLLGLILIGAGCLTALVKGYPDVAKTVWSRIQDPGADIAPWTPLRFQVTPSPLVVQYGDDLPLSVDVTGGQVHHPVMLLTKVDGRELSTPCFREEGQRYSLRLEQVVEPVEFCFTVGRIRSDWQQVTLQLRPKVSHSEVRLIPPAYTGKASRTHAFGERVLKGMAGTRVELELESNRPLSRGNVILRREGEPDQMVYADIDGNRALFSWELSHSAVLFADVVDIQGNPLVRALESHQRVLADEPPRVSLSQPPAFLLATPGIRIPIEGSATDDVGVTRVNLVRGLQGYIDRPKQVGAGEPERRRAFSEVLDLAALGVEAGQTLEVYVEARDHRPGGGRTGVSPLSRIQIISNEEYARNLRQRELLDGFRDRFAAASQSINEVRRTLEELQNEIDSPTATRESLREKLEAAATASRQAEKVFEALNEDFPIYDVEKGAREQMQNLQTHFQKQADALEALSPDDMALDIKVGELTGANRAQVEAAEPNLAEQERFLKLGNLLEQTGEYQELLEKQRLLVRWFERYAYTLPSESREDLKELAAYQEALQEELEAWMTETRKRAAEVGPEDSQWANQALDMLDALKKRDPSGLMQHTSDAARNENNRKALEGARKALAAMLLEKDPEEEQEEQEGEGEGQNGFQAMCTGRGMGGQNPGEGLGLSDSLRQLLDAMKHRGMGRGTGQGTGGGGGGVGGFENDGFSTQGSSPLNIPILGPNRNRFDLPRGGNVQGGEGRGGRGGSGQSGPAISRTQGGGRRAAPAAPAELILEQAPQQYRKAIQIFYDLTPETTP